LKVVNIINYILRLDPVAAYPNFIATINQFTPLGFANAPADPADAPVQAAAQEAVVPDGFFQVTNGEIDVDTIKNTKISVIFHDATTLKKMDDDSKNALIAYLNNSCQNYLLGPDYRDLFKYHNPQLCSQMNTRDLLGYPFLGYKIENIDNFIHLGGYCFSIETLGPQIIADQGLQHLVEGVHIPIALSEYDIDHVIKCIVNYHVNRLHI
jgi:hypothetical protein